MTHNDVLRRLRYLLELPDDEVVRIGALGRLEASVEQVAAWLAKDDHPRFQPIEGAELAAFLNGLIVERRGPRDGPPPVPEADLSHNEILVKLRIAFSMRAEDMVAVLGQGGLVLSKSELSAFFRKPGHKHYRPAQDQMLRKFLQGLQLQHRP